ncbi:Astacin-like metalloprotease toxin, partial [Stegodyphus mimosarum]
MKPQEILLTSPYDYDSIMHYGELSFSKDKKKGLKTMTAKKKGVVLRGVGEKVLSREDINRIQKLYKCS